MLKHLGLLGTLLLVSSLAQAQSVTGALVAGGGTDDMSVVIQVPGGKKYDAYCDGHCGAWFEETGNGEVQALKRAFRQRKVSAELALEPNRDRIAGPSSNEKLTFVKKIKLLD